jgi:hypothetical protein
VPDGKKTVCFVEMTVVGTAESGAVQPVKRVVSVDFVTCTFGDDNQAGLFQCLFLLIQHLASGICSNGTEMIKIMTAL